MNAAFAFGSPELLWMSFGLIPLFALIYVLNCRRRETCQSIGMPSRSGERRAWLKGLAITMLLLAFFIVQLKRVHA